MSEYLIHFLFGNVRFWYYLYVCLNVVRDLYQWFCGPSQLLKLPRNSFKIVDFFFIFILTNFSLRVRFIYKLRL